MSVPPVSKVLTTCAPDAHPFTGRDSFPAWLAANLAWLVLWFVAGCSGSADNLPRQAVSGSVTLDGKPLERGTIAFQPDSALPTAAAVPIAGGQYSMPRSEGLVPGAYRVLVTSTPLTAPTASRPPPPGQATPPPKELLPEKYNASTTLSAEVKERSPNTFDFALESAPKK